LIDDDRDREEVIQDIFIKVHGNLANFQFDAKLSTWIATIAYRHAVNSLRKTKRKGLEDDIDDIDYETGAEDMSFENDDYSKYIQYWISRLPENYRIILTLYHIEGMSYDEIIEVMGMPEGTVKNYLFRARKKLKELLTPLLNSEIFA
jgi:RNA polymerase sigma-70 factor (ECF subfamily)